MRAHNFKDLAGQRFGNWLVLGFDESKVRKAYWNCKCICGREFSVCGAQLRAGRTKQCWLCKQYLPLGIAARNVVLLRYKQNAKERNISWDLSDERFFELIFECCYYCGIPPNLETKNYIGTSNRNGQCRHNGVDRVDSELGYQEGNVVSCCKTCNYAKRQMTAEEFLNWAERIYLHNRERQQCKVYGTISNSGSAA